MAQQWLVTGTRAAGFAAAIALVAAVTSPLAAAKPDFTGRWLLNPEKSDDVAAKMREAGGGPGRGGGPGGMGGGRGPGGMGGGTGGGMGDPSGMGGMDGGGGRGRPGEADRGRRGPGDPREREAAMAELDIDHDDPTLVIIDARAHRRTFRTDGRSAAVGPNGDGPKAKATWKEDRLVIELSEGRGPKITETYQRSATGAQLTVLVKVQGGPRNVSFKRVYDLVTDQADPATPR